MATKLVRITKATGQHVAYDGKNRLASSEFTRPLSAQEVESFRVNPAKFLESVEYVDDEKTAA